jgi:hypothetical protein
MVLPLIPLNTDRPRLDNVGHLAEAHTSFAEAKITNTNLRYDIQVVHFLT